MKKKELKRIRDVLVRDSCDLIMDGNYSLAEEKAFEEGYTQRE